MDNQTPVEELAGVGLVRAKGLARLGIVSVGDLIAHLPRSYEDRTKRYPIAEAPLDVPVCVSGMVAGQPHMSFPRRGLDLTKIKVVDETSSMTVTFFNQEYVRTALIPGQYYTFYGKVDVYAGALAMTNPIFEEEKQNRFTGRIMPIYPLTAGVSNHLFAGLIQRTLPECQIVEKLPPDIRGIHKLMPAQTAYEQIHFPKDIATLDKARRRFIFEELFTLSLGMALLQKRRQKEEGLLFQPVDFEAFYATLPFVLTTAQKRTIDQVAEDCLSGKPMNRLVQGDVGSGKTVIAAVAGYHAHHSGYQAAMMAPTEILAEQHYRTLSKLFEATSIRVGLLTGSMKAKEKREIYAALEQGDIHFLVGTHALISQGVEFHRLGLVVTDEQHRFGVEQRAALAAKATGHPHLLVMSATPIPRTLALIIYGDLEISIIDELPPGRLPIKTLLVGGDKRKRMFGFVREQVTQGRQVYIICPAVEQNPDSTWDLKSVTAYAEELSQSVFPDLAVGFVHGKLKPKEKDDVMTRFAQGELSILVATTVVEVGVDVPNANLIIIENADRYGLSQLHQLRGRVGRGEHASWCVLVSDNRNPDTRIRLKALVESNDGFVIAQTDLDLRGPGDFFGQRQHGLPPLKVADLNADVTILQEAQEAARQLLREDPELSHPDVERLVSGMKQLFAESPDMFQ